MPFSFILVGHQDEGQLALSKQGFFVILTTMGFRVHKVVLTVVAAAILAAGTPLVVFAQIGAETSDPLSELANEYFEWASVHQPSSTSAAIRPARPAGWQPDWTRTALQSRQRDLLKFQSRLKSVNAQLTDTGDRIDASLLAAAMARVKWELEVLASPGRDPGFAVNQSLGSVFELLVENPEPGDSQLAEIILRLERFPAIINAAKLQLDSAVAVLADAAIAQLTDVELKLDQLEIALAENASETTNSELSDGVRAARQALTSYQDWLKISYERFSAPESIGEQKLRWFLGHVAMVPRPLDEIRTEAGLVLAQATARLALDKERIAQAPESSSLDNLQRLLLMMEISQSELGTYLETRNLVSEPASLSGLLYAALPSALAPLAEVGELLSPGENGQPGRRFLRDTEHSSHFLEQAAWSDPRLLLSWEAVPGFGAQFAASGGHEHPIRRHAAYAGQWSGIALYFHEQLSESGLYSFKPASHELALHLLAYKAALAQADIRIALGELDHEGAIEFLGRYSSRDEAGRRADVHDLLANPGNATASFAVYGQVLRFLADTARMEGDEFSLAAFNDRLLKNAHVPIALQRWESLGLENELDELLEQRGRPATVPQ